MSKVTGTEALNGSIRGLGKGADTVISVLMLIISAVILLPVVFIAVISFSSEDSIARYGYRFIAKEWSLDAYRYLGRSTEYILNSFGITIVITLVGTILSLMLISTMAYAISQNDFRLRRLYTALIMLPMFFEGGLAASYAVNTQIFGLKNTIFALILPTACSSWYIIVMRTYFKNHIPGEILEAASRMTAKTEQVNTLKAVQLGARSLKSAVTESDSAVITRKMVILDSCLSTTGALDFTQSSLDGISADDIIRQLRDIGELPDMSTIDEVTVYTCGDTAGKQPTLTESNRETLKDVWSSLFSACGVTANMKDDLPLSAVYDTDALPGVSTVAVEQDSVSISSEEETGEVLQTGVVISFDETSVSFRPGTAELADSDTAHKSLEYVTGFLTSHPNYELLICGTTACWGGEAYCRDLSVRRAEAVRGLLIESGIAEDRLCVAGVGYSFSDFYTHDLTENGDLDESIAPRNRTVKIMDLHSDTAERVLAT